ncbi:Hypothetical_protein [Hexamita inflata]|uniref:Hypothetical_protein n=1 Tax=Hexamita inflata TaxID=28002 RepID=A0AA86ULK9_9EUKA|nr:Hypothetical protein HINF_LOCUS43727 [Hexamita inflata]
MQMVCIQEVQKRYEFVCHTFLLVLKCYQFYVLCTNLLAILHDLLTMPVSSNTCCLNSRSNIVFLIMLHKEFSFNPQKCVRVVFKSVLRVILLNFNSISYGGDVSSSIRTHCKKTGVELIKKLSIINIQHLQQENLIQIQFKSFMIAWTLQNAESRKKWSRKRVTPVQQG